MKATVPGAAAGVICAVKVTVCPNRGAAGETPERETVVAVCACAKPQSNATAAARFSLLMKSRLHRGQRLLYCGPLTGFNVSASPQMETHEHRIGLRQRCHAIGERLKARPRYGVERNIGSEHIQIGARAATT